MLLLWHSDIYIYIYTHLAVNLGTLCFSNVRLCPLSPTDPSCRIEDLGSRSGRVSGKVSHHRPRLCFYLSPCSVPRAVYTYHSTLSGTSLRFLGGYRSWTQGGCSVFVTARHARSDRTITRALLGPCPSLDDSDRTAFPRRLPYHFGEKCTCTARDIHGRKHTENITRTRTMYIYPL